VTEPEPGIAARLLGKLPGMLASLPLIMFGVFLFFYLVVFAGLATIFGHPTAVSANTQLILGNYTNVTSSVAASIAAGASVHAARQRRTMHALLAEVRRLVGDLHEKERRP
jgi:hypothetical protein